MKLFIPLLLITSLLVTACGASEKTETQKPDPRKGYLQPEQTESVNKLLVTYGAAYDDMDAVSPAYKACVKLKDAALNSCIAKLRQTMADTTQALADNASDLAAEGGYNPSCQEAVDSYSQFTTRLAAAWSSSAKAWSAAKVNYDVTDKLDTTAFDLTSKFKDARKALVSACWTKADQDAAAKKLEKAREGFVAPDSFDTLNERLAAVDTAMVKLYDGTSIEACNKFQTQAAVSGCLLKIINPMVKATRGVTEAMMPLRAGGEYNASCQAALQKFSDFSNDHAKAWADDAQLWKLAVVPADKAASLGDRAYGLSDKFKAEVAALGDACTAPADLDPHL